MFETTVVESKKHKIGLQKYLTLPVSIGLHVIVVGGVIFGTVWNVSFPTNSPAQVAQYGCCRSSAPAAASAAASQSRDGDSGREAGGGSEEHPGDGSDHCA